MEIEVFDPAVEATATALTDHILDPTDAHDASAISVIPVGGIAADDVQEALAELDTEKANLTFVNAGLAALQAELDGDEADLAAHLADTVDAHDASAISILDTAGDFTATDVEGALAELRSEMEAQLPSKWHIGVDGSGAVVTTGAFVEFQVPYNVVVTGWRILCANVGSIQLDLWKDSYANYPPTIADTIVAAAPPAVVSDDQAESTTLTGWDTTWNAGEIIRAVVTSRVNVTRAVLIIEYERVG